MDTIKAAMPKSALILDEVKTTTTAGRKGWGKQKQGSSRDGECAQLVVGGDVFRRELNVSPKSVGVCIISHVEE